MRWRRRCILALDAIGTLDVCGALTAPLASRDLTILMYHRIAVPDPTSPFGSRAISTTPDEFEAHMRWIHRYAHPIGFAELAELEARGRPLPRRAVVVTFDDGYLDNYLNAFPILREFRVPSTVFLVTDRVGTLEPFWWDAVTVVMRKQGGSDADIIQEVERLKRLPNTERRRVIADLNIPPLPRTVMNWDEVREMSQCGVDFGAHTVSHPVLSTLPAEELDTEIAESKKRIEQELGTRVVAFAYPVGRAFTLNDSVVNAVARAGYRYAVTTAWGRNRPDQMDRLRLQRLGIGLEDYFWRFKGKVLFPRFFGPIPSGGIM